MEPSTSSKMKLALILDFPKSLFISLNLFETDVPTRLIRAAVELEVMRTFWIPSRAHEFELWTLSRSSMEKLKSLQNCHRAIGCCRRLNFCPKAIHMVSFQHQEKSISFNRGGIVNWLETASTLAAIRLLHHFTSVPIRKRTLGNSLHILAIRTRRERDSTALSIGIRWSGALIKLRLALTTLKRLPWKLKAAFGRRAILTPRCRALSILGQDRKWLRSTRNFTCRLISLSAEMNFSQTMLSMRAVTGPGLIILLIRCRTSGMREMRGCRPGKSPKIAQRKHRCWLTMFGFGLCRKRAVDRHSNYLWVSGTKSLKRCWKRFYTSINKMRE